MNDNQKEKEIFAFHDYELLINERSLIGLQISDHIWKKKGRAMITPKLIKRLAEKLAISEEELYDICRGKINDFSLSRLMSYLEKLPLEYELLVIDKQQRESKWAE